MILSSCFFSVLLSIFVGICFVITLSMIYLKNLIIIYSEYFLLGLVVVQNCKAGFLLVGKHGADNGTFFCALILLNATEHRFHSVILSEKPQLVFWPGLLVCRYYALQFIFH